MSEYEIVLESNAETTQRLVRRNDVLSTVCGFEHHTYVVRAAVAIQAASRGWILRKDKRTFEIAVHVFLKACRRHVYRRRFAAVRRGVVQVQAVARGWRVRASPIGRAVSRIVQYEQECVRHEIMLLRR